MDDQYFEFTEESKEHVTILLVNMMAMTPSLPDYCIPSKDLMWTKGIPATTRFAVPIKNKQDIADHLKKQGYIDCTS